jgi:hypothetical protein
MDKKKVSKPKKPKVPKIKSKPKVSKPKVPNTKSKPKVSKPKKTKVLHKGGSSNIGTSTKGLFTSFWDFGKEVFNEIDLLTKTPGKLGKIAN